MKLFPMPQARFNLIANGVFSMLSGCIVDMACLLIGDGWFAAMVGVEWAAGTFYSMMD